MSWRSLGRSSANVPAGKRWGRGMTAGRRGFARYLSGIDPRTEIPPAGLVPLAPLRRPPFIYTEAEILALMDAARSDTGAAAAPRPMRP